MKLSKLIEQEVARYKKLNETEVDHKSIYEFLEKLTILMNRYKVDIAASGSDFLLTDQRGNTLDYELPDTSLLKSADQCMTHMELNPETDENGLYY